MHLHKWRAILILLSIVCINAGAQTRITLIMSTDKPVDSIYVVHWTDREIYADRYSASSTISFAKTSGVDFYHINYLAKDHNYFTSLYLDTGNITMHLGITDDKVVIDEMTGSKFYPRYALWQMDYLSAKNRNDTAALEKFLLNSYEDFADNQFSFAIARIYMKLVRNEKQKLIPLYALISDQPNDVKTGFIFDGANRELLGLLRNQSVNLSVFNLINRSNKTIHPPSGQGLVLLDFWFVGCIPCEADHVKIAEKLSYFKDHNVSMVSISRDSSFNRWTGYLNKHGYNWTQYKIPPGKETIVDILGLVNYPTYILLDSANKILFITNSLSEVEMKLESITSK